MLREFINDNCIFRCPPGYFLKGIPAGHAYSWQFYLRKAIFHKIAGPLITEWFVGQHNKGVQYAAMESAGPPILSAMQTYKFFDPETKNDELIPGFAIRKDQKKYGLMNWIEGPVEELPVVLLDDIANSKTTLIRAKDVCESFGMEVVGALAIVNKKESSDVNGVPLRSMFVLDDFDLDWKSYYNKHPDREPDISLWVEEHKEVLLKKVFDDKEYTVLDAVSNPGLLEGFNQVDINQGE